MDVGKSKGVGSVRPRYLNFEQLVHQNKQELLNDENELSEIEMRFENRQAELVHLKREEGQSKSS